MLHGPSTYHLWIREIRAFNFRPRLWPALSKDISIDHAGYKIVRIKTQSSISVPLRIDILNSDREIAESGRMAVSDEGLAAELSTAMPL
jgi:hypothetical protein